MSLSRLEEEDEDLCFDLRDFEPEPSSLLGWFFRSYAGGYSRFSRAGSDKRFWNKTYGSGVLGEGGQMVMVELSRSLRRLGERVDCQRECQNEVERWTDASKNSSLPPWP